MADSTQQQGSYIFDAENAAEMARLINQDRIMTRCMGGLFPPRLDLSSVQDVLDIACGPGGWVLDVAKEHPDKRVTGIDISQLMTEFARYQAMSQGLHNAHFVVMDALKPLDFPDNSFDFVNARFVSSFMPKQAWPLFMQECTRITRRGGIMRLTEFEANMTTSYAFERLHQSAAWAMHKAGQSFSPTGWQFGITPMLGRFLRDVGYQSIQKMSFVLDSSAGTEDHLSQYQNALVALKLIQPYLVKTSMLTQEEAESLYQRALEEMMSPDYCAVWYFLSAWGEKPR